MLACASKKPHHRHMSNEGEVYRFASELGVLPEAGEKHPSFIKRFGEFVAGYVDDQRAVDNILNSVRKRYRQDPRVVRFVAAVNAEAGNDDSSARDEKLVDLLAGDIEYPEGEYHELIRKYYPNNDSTTTQQLFDNQEALKFMVAPSTQSVVYEEFIDSARGFARSSNGLGGASGRFLSLQRLAGTARYASGRNERLVMCEHDLEVLDTLRIRIEDSGVVAGPALEHLLNVDVGRAGELTYAPSRLALDSVVREVASQLGSQPKELVDKGYLLPAQVALVVDITRALTKLRSK